MLMPREIRNLQKLRVLSNARAFSSFSLRRPFYNHRSNQIDRMKVLGALRFSSIFEKFSAQAQLQTLRKNVRHIDLN